ncbi:MAG: hypothetical protein PVI30_10115 [Myxococcales bacterium]|jgi:hypothetical protein
MGCSGDDSSEQQQAGNVPAPSGGVMAPGTAGTPGAATAGGTGDGTAAAPGDSATTGAGSATSPGDSTTPPGTGGDPSAGEPMTTEPAMNTAGSSAPPPPPTGSGCLQPGGGDYLQAGPYTVATVDVSIGSSGMYTIFYPQPFEEGCGHPIVAWGNGTGVTGSGTYAFYNEHAASWGVVVVASHESDVGSGEFHRAGLDYLLAENENPESMFYQRLSPRAGTSGHSQGGMGANAGASHPNVEAEVNVQGAFGGAPAGVSLLCLTGTMDLNPAGCASATAGTSEPAMYANWDGGDHFGTATLAGFIGGDAGSLQYMRLYAAWFRCFLADDSAACALFQSPCQVCGDPGWAEIEMYNY